MKRGKRFLENDNIFIYVGTTIFILLSIALGIIMYMFGKTENKIEDSEQISQQVENNTETVTSEIGKTVKQQEEIENTDLIKNNENKSENESKEENTKVTESVIKTNENNTTSQEKIIEEKKEITFLKPIEGEIICEFAKDNLIYSETLKEWITHMGIDIKADKTSVIKASADGVVKTIVNDPRYGLTVIINHDDGYETIYSNLLTAEFVVEGEEITQGQTIGTVGNTSSFESSMESHVHFELLKDGEYLNPTIYIK